jgi:hypothetical protein
MPSAAGGRRPATRRGRAGLNDLGPSCDQFTICLGFVRSLIQVYLPREYPDG